MILDEDKRTLHFKIAYWGPALAGKTSSLQHLHDSTPPSFRGELSCPHATESDRILFFDLEWLENVPRSHRVRLHLYTNPGSVLHDTSRQQALSDADGIVAVWDTRQERLDANTKSLDELGSFLSSQERSLRDVPLVHQYNKRDLRPVKALKGEEVLESPALPELEAALNGEGRPSFGSVAYQGVGVRESLRALTRSLLGSHRNCWVKAPEDSEFPSTLASLLETWREERRSSARSMLSDAWESAPNDTSLDELLADCHDHGLTFFELGERSGDWLRVLHDEDITELGTRLSRELGTDSIVAWHQQVPELASFQLWCSGVLRRQLTSSKLDGWLVNRGDRHPLEGQLYDSSTADDRKKAPFGEDELRRACRHLGLELPPSAPAWTLPSKSQPI